MSEKTYNGWTNYETWAVNVWGGFDDDPGISDLVEESFNAGMDKEETIRKLRDWMKEIFEDDCPELDNSPYADLLNAAMSEINWHELAEHYVESPWSEFQEEEEEEESQD